MAPRFKLEELFFDDEYFANKEARSKLRKEHTYLFDLICVLLTRKTGMRRSITIDLIESQRRKHNILIIPTFEQTVQSVYNRHCQDSDTFTAPASEALFYTPEGKGSGRWAVHRDRALEWLEKHYQTLI